MKSYSKRLISRWVFPVLAVLFCVRLSYGADVTFYGIGQLPGGAVNSQIRSAIMTSTGILAGGNAQQNPASAFADTPILWTPTAGLVKLSPFLNIAANPSGRFVTVSQIASGKHTVAGRNYAEATGRYVQPALYTELGQLTAVLGLPEGAILGAANAISANGRIVYGFFADDSGNYQGYRWTVAEGPSPLPAIPGYPFVVPAASGCSSDGSLDVGAAGNTYAPGSVAFVYSAGSDTISLLPFAPGGTWAGASGIDSTGTYIAGVGDSTTCPNGEALLWAGGTVTELGIPAKEAANGLSANFIGVTSDGSVMVLAGALGSYLHNAYGWSDLQTALSAGGGALTGWTVLSVLGCNPDGTLVFGSGIHNGGLEGFVVKLSAGYLKNYGKPKKSK